MLKKVEWEVTNYDIWESRCYWLAYKMMTNIFNK